MVWYNNSVVSTAIGSTPNTWYFYAVTINATKYMKLYANGVYVNGTQIANWQGDTSMIWGDGGTPVESTHGFMDEMGFWNRTLTDAEVLGLYNLTNGTTYPFNGINTGLINLISPTDNTKSPTASQTFIMNATSPIVGLKSISLYTNTTGTWQLNDTKANPIAHYKLNTANFSIKDQTNVSDGMSLYNGTLVGKTFNNGIVSGAIIEDSAMKFDGVDDYVNASNITFINSSKPYTFSLWINVKQFPASSKLTSLISFRGTSLQNSTGIDLDSTGSVILKTRNDTLTISSGSKTITSGEWYHVVGIFNGINYQIYVNGIAGSVMKEREFVGSDVTVLVY
jgi:hypothetical protein